MWIKVIQLVILASVSLASSEQFLAWLPNSGMVLVWPLLVVVLFVRFFFSFFLNYSFQHTINSRSLKCFPRSAEPFSCVVMQPWPWALFLSSAFSPSPLKIGRCISLEQELCMSQNFCSMKPRGVSTFGIYGSLFYRKNRAESNISCSVFSRSFHRMTLYRDVPLGFCGLMYASSERSQL